MNETIELYRAKLMNQEKLSAKQIAILETCRDLFAKKGFANTSTSDIAKQAQVAEGTIFKHFGTKQNLLFITLIPIFSNLLLEEMHFNLDEQEPLPFATLLHKVIHNFIQQEPTELQLIRIFIGELMYREDFRQELLALIPQELTSQIYRLLDHYKERSEIVAWPNPSIIRFILSPLISYIMLLNSQLLTATKNDPQAELARIEHFILQGLTPNA